MQDLCWKFPPERGAPLLIRGRGSGRSNTSTCRLLSRRSSSCDIPPQFSRALETICVQLIILPREIMRLYREPRGETLAFERSTLCLHFQTPGGILIQGTRSSCTESYMCTCSCYKQSSTRGALLRVSAAPLWVVFFFPHIFQPVHDCGSRGHAV